MRKYYCALVCVFLVFLSQLPNANARQTATSAQTGYVRIIPNAQSYAPAGVAIFGMENSGILTTEAGVPFSSTIQSGRVFVEVNTSVASGIAIANPSGTAVTVTYFLTDTTGQNFGAGSFTVSAQQQISAFLTNPPFSLPSPILGTLTFNASGPIAAEGLRSFVNERGDVLLTTVPVMPLGTALGGNSLLIPYAVSASSLTMQIVLVNPGDTTLSGSIEFYGQGPKRTTKAVGTAGTLQLVNVLLNNVTNSDFNYSIPARSIVQFEPQSTFTGATVEAVRIKPSNRSTPPSALAVLTYNNSGVTVSMATITAPRPARAQRTYAESSGVFGQISSVETVLAMENPSGRTVTASLEIINLDGESSGLSASVNIPPNGEVSNVLTDLFPTLPVGFRGIFRVTAPSAIALTSVRSRFNERGDLLVTNTPPYDEASAPMTEMYFPVFASGGGYSTQLILFSTGLAESGSLYLVTQNGSVLPSTSVQPTP
jgi:hypothetical protein